MTSFFFNTLQESHLGYAAIFACIGMGFLFLRRVDHGEVGPGYWVLSFFMGSLGFLFWSGVIPILTWQYYLGGEAFHILGFLLLVCGAYRFTGHGYKRWNFLALAAWLVIWLGAIALIPKHEVAGTFLLRGLRAVLFSFAGIVTLRKAPKEALVGRRLAGWSLIAWAVYIVAFTVMRFGSLKNLAFGLLVGFQVLAAFGMVVMVIDRIKTRAEESEKRVKRLEGLLPICAYCKKIRDKDNTWHTIEAYIEERSSAEFSHGICPDCLEKHRPDA